MRTEQSKPLPIFLIYGVPKVGKTTLASEFPNPIYLNTPGESAPVGVKVSTPGEIDSFESVMGIFGELYSEDHDRKTVIVDSLDGLEPYMWAEACRRNGWSSIEEPGYGKGYIAVDSVWREYIRAIEALAKKGIMIVQIAHHEIVRFDSPIADPYSRYQIKLHKRASALVQESSSVIGFINFRTSLKEKEVGFNKTISRQVGSGDREIHLEERPGFTAGNRFNMPSSIQYKAGNGFTELSKHFS